MSLEPVEAIDFSCPNCFCSFQLNSHSLPVSQLMAIKLQMDEMGSEIECPRCKTYFLVTNSPEPHFQKQPHFHLQENATPVSATY